MTVTESLFRYVSRQAKVANVASAWRHQYGDSPTDPRFADVLARLDALDLSRTTPEEIDAIIGNTSWTTDVCSICQEDTGDGWFEFETWGDGQIMCRNCAGIVRTILGAVE